MAVYSGSTSASKSASPDSAASSASSPRSSAREMRPFQASSSSRSPSAARRTRLASRESFQKSGREARSSNAASSLALPSRSKPPRGRVDAGHEVPDQGMVHRRSGSVVLASRAKVLQQQGSQLDDLQCGLAASDHGVHARAVAIVYALSAVAIAVQPSGVAAVPAVSLACDQVSKGLISDLGLGLNRKRLHVCCSPSSVR